MARLAIVPTNFADAGNVTATSQVAGMGVQNLLTSPHTWDDQYRSVEVAPTVSVDLLADTTLDSFAALGIYGATPSLTCRLKVSTVGAGAGAGDALDTGVLAAGSAYLSTSYGMFVYLAPAPVVGRYLDFYPSDAGASYVQFGRFVAGLRTQLDYNFAQGSTFDWLDTSPVRETRGGQTMTWQRRPRRVANLSLPIVSNSQRWGLVETLGKTVGVHQAVLLCLDPEADDLPQNTMWAMLTDQTPAAYVALADSTAYSKQLSARERL